jgi:hypothetical protein
MKKSIAFVAVAVVVVGAAWQHSRRSAPIALSSIEKQSLHDAPNDGDDGLNRDNSGGYSGGVIGNSDASGVNTGNTSVNSPVAQEIGVSADQSQLTDMQLDYLNSLATYVYKNGKETPFLSAPSAPSQRAWSLTKGVLRKHQFTVAGVVQSDGGLKVTEFFIAKPNSGGDGIGISSDGSIHGPLSFQDQGVFQKELTFWLDCVDVLGLGAMNRGE